ncbi:MAG: hypothetical protein NWE88_11075 [Candidatus Bathyarchaeota archaeon]|nr:hypothetical protein [Candidatus Bathyarchaeota archaeon]
MPEFEEVKPILQKIFETLDAKRYLLIPQRNGWYPKTMMGDKKLRVQHLEDLAGNHLFDDHPYLFGISKREAQMVRSYLQTNTASQKLLDEMYEAFTLLEGEDEKYLEHITLKR